MATVKHELRDVIGVLQEGVEVIGFDWRYLLVNAAAVDRLQRRAEELVGRRLQDCYPGIEDTALFALLRRVMEERRPEAGRWPSASASGPQRWFELRVEPVGSGICILSMDVTERQGLQEHLRAVEEQLHQLQKLESVSRLVGGVAHDFKNQLTVILGLTQFVLERQDLAPEVVDDLHELDAAAQRSAALTKQLLAFGRRQQPQLERVHLPAIVDAARGMLGRLLKPNVELELTLEPATEWIRGDRAQLESILANLAMNAVDAMPEGGRLTIATDTTNFTEPDALQRRVMRRGRYTVLTVTDTGIGMDETTKARVFDPFFTTKDAGEGTGLGLVTVYGMVKQMGGFIWIDSALGQGTAFRLYFPVTVGVPTATPQPTTSAPRRPSSETILVLEDDDAVRPFVVRALESEGYHVLSAATPEEADSHLLHPHMSCDLLLCDVVLPGPNGFSFAQSRFTNSRVIFMTGYSDMVNQLRDASTAVTLLQKPFTKDELIEVVRASLRAERG